VAWLSFSLRFKEFTKEGPSIPRLAKHKFSSTNNQGGMKRCITFIAGVQLLFGRAYIFSRIQPIS
jgi:hypothetical protein